MASSFSSHGSSQYQVFLSFRGKDTRNNFTNHLLNALKDSGIDAFYDQEKLEKGVEVRPTLLNAIAASKMSIIILSKNYASSEFCLRELSKIMDCNKLGQDVLPVFFRVDPSDVRKRTGCFKKPFIKHGLLEKPEVEGWKDAFTQVGHLNGCHIVGGIYDRSETEYIKDIVEVVIKKLNSKSACVSKELVGIDDQMKKISRLLDQEHIRVIGVCGMGGIGKTTLAEAVYNEVLSRSKFDAHHFLQDVRERSLDKYGVQSLQNELLSKLLKEDIHIDTRFIGSTLIQDRLLNKRVFVVLDDVNNFDQIKSLGVDYFGDGSKIIVTSRDRQVLRNIGDHEPHKVKELNPDDSLQLLSKFAFKQYNPDAGFRDLAMKFVQYAGGNPLALKVLGAALYKRSRDEWKSALHKLEEYPEQDILGPLRLSFDGLDRLERNIFLDIACFFKEENIDNNVTKLLRGFYKGAEFGISSLVDKCLVDDRYGDLEMHNLLQEMGRDVVRQESEDPKRRSRLWSPEDVYRVLKNNKGTKSIKGISLDISQIKAPLQICPTAFEKMDNLVFIRFQVRRYNMKGHNKLLVSNQALTYLPGTLRYFHWDYCPLRCLPSNFTANKLVELRLPNSNIKRLWKGNQDVDNLRLMDLRRCKNLRKIPNLSGATKLETLLCGGCKSLVKLPCMTHLTSLKHLHLSGCPITKFPETPKNLEELFLPDTQIEQFPWSISSLKKLYSLHMGGTKIQSISSSIVRLDTLEYINFNMTPIEEVPPSISRLQSLKELYVRSCKSLKSLSELPPWLEVLDAEDCTSLERVSFTDHEYVRELNCITQFRFRNCFNLNQVARNNIIAAYPTIITESIAKHSAAKQLTKKLDENVEEELHEVLYYLPGSEISEKFENQSTKSSITVKLRPASSRTERFLCFALCFVFDLEHLPAHDNRLYSIHTEYKLKDTGGSSQSFKREWDPIYCEAKPILPGRSGEHVFVLFRQDMVHSDKYYVEATFKFYVVCQYFHDKNFHNRDQKKVEVKKCGVHVFYVDAETFAVSHNVDSCINFKSDEDNRCCPILLSLGELNANVENIVHGEDPAATSIPRLDCKRSFSSGMRQSRPRFLGENTVYDQHHLISAGSSVFQYHQENESCGNSTLTTESERSEITEASPDLNFLKGQQQHLNTPNVGFQQPLDMQQELMLKQFQGPPSQKQLQMSGDARQQNTLNQPSAIAKQSVVGHFSPIINGAHVHEAPPMFMNTVQQRMPPRTIGASNRVVFPQDQGPAFCSMGLSSQQSDASLSGTPVASARSNMNQYSQQGISNHPVKLLTKAGGLAKKPTMKSSGIFGYQYTALQDQVYKIKGGLKSNPEFQAKNMFGPTSLGPNTNSSNSPFSPNGFSLGGSKIEDGTVGNGHASTTSRLDAKRKFSSDDDRYYTPQKRAKLFPVHVWGYIQVFYNVSKFITNA